MKKALTYLSFAAASIVVIIAFVTAKSYTQLAIAAALYPAVAYFAYQLFLHRPSSAYTATATGAVGITPPPAGVSSAKVGSEEPQNEQSRTADVVDIDKRAFLKIIGATGLSYFIFSLLGRRVETLLFNRPQGSWPSLGGGTGAPQLLPTAGYQISEIDDSYVAFYGFTGPEGRWFIMKEDPELGSFRYAKGESDFSGNWKNRADLKYDYFHKVF